MVAQVTVPIFPHTPSPHSLRNGFASTSARGAKRPMRASVIYAIVIAFLSAAFLTPPDPFSQISLALPIILLYEISIYIAKIIQKNKQDD